MKKVAFSLTLVFLLTCIFALAINVQPVKLQGLQTIYVDPPESIFYTNTMNVNSTFPINITIRDAANVGGIQFRLEWNSTVLSCESIILPAGHFMDPLGAEEAAGNLWVIQKQIGTGYTQYAVTYLNMTAAIERGTVPRAGNGTLATLTMKIIEEAPTSTPLTLKNVIISDPSGTQLSTQVEDGNFSYLVSPWPDIAVANVTFTETVVTPGYSMFINVTVENLGGSTETFNVSVYYNDTVITQPNGKNYTSVTLTEGNSSIIIFTWNTTGVALGSYVISAYAWPVPGEIDVENNTYTDGTIEISTHDVAVIDVTTSKTGCLPMPTVGQGFSLRVNVTTGNLGGFTETFNVTVYANSSAIGEQQVTLNPEENKILTFVWDTKGWDKGNYTISATADSVLGENETSDNTFVDGWILVTIPGDINGDKTVNILDAILVSKAFGARPASPNWSPNADTNDDGLVNLLDAISLAGTFGETWA